MELKQIINKDRNLIKDVLIVPYGIETHYTGFRQYEVWKC